MNNEQSTINDAQRADCPVFIARCSLHISGPNTADPRLKNRTGAEWAHSHIAPAEAPRRGEAFGVRQASAALRSTHKRPSLRSSRQSQSGRGLPHSTTLPRPRTRHDLAVPTGYFQDAPAKIN